MYQRSGLGARASAAPLRPVLARFCRRWCGACRRFVENVLSLDHDVLLALSGVLFQCPDGWLTSLAALDHLRRSVTQVDGAPNPFFSNVSWILMD